MNKKRIEILKNQLNYIDDILSEGGIYNNLRKAYKDERRKIKNELKKLQTC